MVDELKPCSCWASTDPAHRALCPLHGAGRALPRGPSGSWDKDYSFALCFDDGVLTVNADGSGIFSFRDDVLDWDEKDCRSAKVLNSEIIAIRDQLNKLFPPSAAPPAAVPGYVVVPREVLERVVGDWDHGRIGPETLLELHVDDFRKLLAASPFVEGGEIE